MQGTWVKLENGEDIVTCRAPQRRIRIEIPKRDSQRSRVYAAEKHVWSSVDLRLDADGMRDQLARMIEAHGVPTELRFSGRLRGANAQVKSLARGGWVHRISIGEGWLETGTYGNAFVVPHEYAHVLCAAAARGPDRVFDRDPWHHPAWCAVYLALLARHLGPEFAQLTRCSFEKHGVIYAESPTVVRRVLRIEQENRT